MEQVQALIGFVGVLLQLAGALLLAGLFLLLRRYARRRRWFATWAASWMLLAVAIAALVVRHIAFPSGQSLAAEPIAEALFFLHQLAALSHVVLLVAGTMIYVNGSGVTPFVPAMVTLSAAYALVSVYAGNGIAAMVVWQAPAVAAGLGWCGVSMLTLPRSRRGVGASLASAGFFGTAALAIAYMLASLLSGGAAGAAAPVQLLMQYHQYGNVVLTMVLGSAMVVMVMEEAKREVDDAHAELAVAHNELRRAALYDSVTGTLNRRAFAEGVGLETARAKFGAVMMLDLDELKNVNDAHGHSAGDALLRHLADALRSSLRPSDRVYRWGGDEFLLVLSGADAARAHARLRSVISSAAVLRLGPNEREVRLSVSIGSAGYTGAEHMMKAIDEADAMMYEDKNRKKLGRSSGTGVS